uniref:Fatty acid hydroxylase domain-containing protein n=1 Tax=Cucumis sativus TaxID=3659 RepID=A0A0A0LD51_CUCSA
MQSYKCNRFSFQVSLSKLKDDQILFNGLLFCLGRMVVEKGENLPLWRTNGVVIAALLHAGPVEFLYYWFHRALHHHFLYSRYHSHHHSSIATEPITCKLYLSSFNFQVSIYQFFMT